MEFLAEPFMNEKAFFLSSCPPEMRKTLRCSSVLFGIVNYSFRQQTKLLNFHAAEKEKPINDKKQQQP